VGIGHISEVERGPVRLIAEDLQQPDSASAVIKTRHGVVGLGSGSDPPRKASSTDNLLLEYANVSPQELHDAFAHYEPKTELAAHRKQFEIYT
jgi:hypothetical protein